MDELIYQSDAIKLTPDVVEQRLGSQASLPTWYITVQAMRLRAFAPSRHSLFFPGEFAE